MKLRPFIAVALALLVAAASILSGPAMARGPEGRTVELCTLAGAQTVTVDERGNPVAPHRPCPLCLAAQDLALPPAPIMPLRPPAVARAQVPLHADTLVALRQVRAASARAPPLQV